MNISILFAQQIEGKLVDGNYQGIAYTKIEVLKQSKVVASTISEADGSFLIEKGFETGYYEVKIYAPTFYHFNRLYIPNDQLWVLNLTTKKDDAALTYTEIELSNFELWNIPVAKNFQYPVSSKGVISRHFREQKHLGEDWNIAPGNEDIGEPIYAIAAGLVIFNEDLGGKWGRVIRVLHNIGTKEFPVFIESVYAHLNSSEVYLNKTIKKGDIIGKMGNANGSFYAHLHFEIRNIAGLPLGVGYGNYTDGYENPIEFLKKQKAVFIK